MTLQNIDFSDYSGLDCIKPIQDTIKSEGYVLIKNASMDTPQFETFCRSVGDPYPHDSDGTIVWDIKARETQTSKVITYSEHAHYADLHTDSQYSENPEDFFALLTLKKANCGGGKSLLLSVKDILAELDSSEQGKRALDILSTTKFPFIVPNVFKLDDNKTSEFNFGTIFQPDGKIRFRIDTVRKAIDLNPDFCSDVQIEAFNFLVSLIQTTTHTQSFFLEDNDLIFINNKTMLHGRTGFTDSNRHLLRIRMNFYND